VSEGRLFRGVTGCSGEFGHQTVLPGGPRCECGKDGCLEALVSGSAVARRAGEWAARYPESRLASVTGRLTAATVAELAAQGDPIACRVWEETGYYLGIGVSQAIMALNPDLVLLGGGVIQAGELILEPTRRSARRHTSGYSFEAARIEEAALGENIGILGAIAIALEAGGISPLETGGVRG
jgi:glucokinase